MQATKSSPETTLSDLPQVPLTLEGSAVLHQMMRFRWSEWRRLPENQRAEILAEASTALAAMEQRTEGQSGLFSLLGHKGDFLLVHFRNTFDEVQEAEIAIARLRLSEYFEVTHSYVSVVELGLYESTLKTYKALQERGVEPHSAEWKAEIESVMARQREAMRSRLFPALPEARYISFYPMDRKRGEMKNWYTLPLEERQRQMNDHGLIGRRYAGEVKQIITGSIGFDDWEWGVTLFAEDPLIFKKLIYEMRFDEVSAVYALFGSFYFGIRRPASQLASHLQPAP